MKKWAPIKGLVKSAVDSYCLKIYEQELKADYPDLCGFELITEGMEDITGISGLMDIMLAYGYDRSDINKIMGLNWLRIYESLLP